MRVGRVEITLGSVLAVVLVGSGAVILHQRRRLADYQRQQAEDRQSLAQLREALRQRELQKPPSESEGEAAGAEYQANIARRDAAIEQLNRELSAAQANITELKAQLSSSNDERERALASAQERHLKEQEDWQKQLDAFKQNLDSTQAELEASRQRIAALEADNGKLRGAANEGSARTAEFQRTLADLQDLDRRRDAYLTSLSRRYRDITNQFRAMTGILDSSRDSNANAFNEASLTRIENTVSLADDDLRQLNELNAQARQLEKKLGKK